MNLSHPAIVWLGGCLSNTLTNGGPTGRGRAKTLQARRMDNDVSKKPPKSHEPAVRTPEEKALISQAKEMVMKKFNLKEPQAYKLMQHKAMNQRESLVTISRRMIESGQLEPSPRA